MLRLKPWLILLAISLPLAALSQLPVGNGDYPGLKGGSARQGKNLAPNSSHPGQALLKWFSPKGLVERGIVQVRNNNYVDNTGNGQLEGAWAGAQDANDYYDAVKANPTEANATLVDSLNGASSPLPHYLYSRIINSVRGNPTQKQNAGDQRKVFEWRFDPTEVGTGIFDASRRVSRNYQLYVWIPQGPTNDGGTNRYSARYYVYEVLYGNGLSYVEVLDTYAAGRGWVRLGNSGSASNIVFPYNGLLPLRIRLYNTNPRDESILPPNGRPDDDLRNDPQSVVYADAALAVPDTGSFSSSPVVSNISLLATPNFRAVAARNVPIVTNASNGQAPTVETKGVLTSYNHDTGVKRWSFSPRDLGAKVGNQDNTSAGVTNNGFFASVAGGIYQGIDYLTAPVVNGGGISTVRYQPTLGDGDYEVQIYIAGGATFGRKVQFEVNEGAEVEVHEVDLSKGPGWYRLGSRRYRHSNTGDALSVTATNFSTLATDIGKNAFADAVRFVGEGNLAIVSTPVQVKAKIRLTPGGVPTDTAVVVVAAEDGRVYCLDAEGKPDGTTTVYWAYPSLPQGGSWTDPNHVAGLDGAGGIAEMPTGFDTASPIVERIGGVDYAYVGGSNGRIYCIEMAGRGDFNATTGVAGTTQRRWSYPSDYPSTAVPSSLGRFKGSPAFAFNGPVGTLYVPTTQGRMYALDGLGNGTTKTTTVRWAFPALTSPTLGAIYQTPAVFGNAIYFGTTKKDDNPGQFYALELGTGSVAWSKADLDDDTAEDYLGGPVVVDRALLGATNRINVVFTVNENRKVYAWDAATGANYWPTSEPIYGGAVGNPVFTPLRVYDNTGALTATPVPCLVVPTSDGRVLGLFARATDLNILGTRRAYQWNTEGALQSSLAVGGGLMYAGDDQGYLYAFDNNGYGSDYLDDGEDEPGDEEVVENNPDSDSANLRFAKVGLVDAAMYQLLRQPDPDMTVTRAALVAALRPPPVAFEWGETVYAVVYDFTYDASQNQIAQFTVGTDGNGGRQNPVEVRRLQGNAAVPENPSIEASGYGIYAFTIQGGGSSALPPGEGRISASIVASIGLNDRRTVGVRNNGVDFSVANPIAIFMAPEGTPTGFVVPTNSNLAIGYNTVASDPQNLVNGSPNVAGTAHSENLLASSVGQIANGQTGITQIFVADRSLMTLVRGPGRGLDNVRVERKDLAWVGGSTAVMNPLNALLFPGFEDLPTRFPNDSLDYPDVRRDQIRVIRDLLGSPENPALRQVFLNPPKDSGGGDLDDPTEGATRRLTNTPFDFEVDFPRFQPPNASTIIDSRGVALAGGYAGRFNVFVDSNQSGSLDAVGSRREAYRSFTLSGQVLPDRRLSVGTPTIDLGSLATGAGYDPLLPAAASSSFGPWDAPKTAPNGLWSGLFAPLSVFNEGNMNLLNVRLAKGTNQGLSYSSWPIVADANDELAWLDSAFDVWTDFDKNAKFNLGYPAIIQKARVGDRQTTSLSPNPVRRSNPAIGTVDGSLLPNPSPANPRIGVTVPLGFPSGTYKQTMRVIEDSIGDDQSMSLAPSGLSNEAFTDPSFELIFKVREARVTNTTTKQPTTGNPMTYPFMDDFNFRTSGPSGPRPYPAIYTYSSLQPAIARSAGGDLLMAMTSNRPVIGNVGDNGNLDSDAGNSWRIYLAGLNGGTPGVVDTTVGASPLRDLHRFAASASGRWFNPTQPFPFGNSASNPAAANAAFGAAGTANDHVLGTLGGEADTVSFGSAAFPSSGFLDPLNVGNAFGSLDMAFLGEAQKQTSSGRIGESRLFVAPVTVAADGSVSTGAIVSVPVDPSMAKGKPSIVQTTGYSFIYFSGAGTGQAQIYYTVLNRSTGQFTTPLILRTGNGFESVSSPSATVRPYLGVDGSQAGGAIELSFTGKLRGRSSTEVFYSRIRLSGGTPADIVSLGERNRERLLADREGGVYRAQGVNWSRQTTPTLYVLVRNGAAVNEVNAEVPGTRTFDPNSGIISFDTVLGGKAYLDPNMGTVRFSSATINRLSELLLTYRPRALRISSGTASYGAPTLLYDNRNTWRPVGDPQYWARTNNTSVTDTDVPRAGRYMFFYGRAAAGNGQTSRPMVQTVRLGLQLPFGVHTQDNGDVTSLSVNPASSFYQVDPANGRIYFSAQDEDRTVSVTYVGVDPTSGLPLAPITITGTVSMLTERAEAPVSIEQAVNETGLAAALDPFDSERRPGLVWLIWASTRSGSPDIFFQTIAPRYSPVPKGGG
jgi:hypothetical protein